MISALDMKSQTKAGTSPHSAVPSSKLRFVFPALPSSGLGPVTVPHLYDCGILPYPMLVNNDLFVKFSLNFLSLNDIFFFSSQNIDDTLYLQLRGERC